MMTDTLHTGNSGIDATTIKPLGTSTTDVAPISLDDRVREFEASLISWALTVSGGNKSKAARLLQIKRSTLGDRINRCGLGQTSKTAVVAPARQ